MLKDKRFVLFDIDGTLIDSRLEIIACIRAALAGLGHKLDTDQNLDFCLGPPMSSSMRKVLEHYGDDRVAEALTLFYAHQAQLPISNVLVYSGIIELLDTIRATDRQMFIATSKMEDIAGRLLSRLGLHGYFRAVHGALPGDGQKSKEEIIQFIIETFNLPRSSVIMIGDRSFDMIGATANQVTGAGALWGYGSAEELVASGAQILWDTPTEVVQAFQQS
ncbi:HAD hydrolase-like protein (plasmid) [Agrobacterium sp. rho-13.3]|uniref:HAD hydrolase-like protein n=1 Tax=Agrobacterium sp. rho-13.3 TaxID=3072980 RepID=UPI002A15AE42|nr:HAD hydrolase-like protein [Agrobacterium sp. rho-13.3]MDX8312046.1 HAD hydrolase-like protein [Agrobacterium sp. rho-13.3]